jgi:ATP-dependent helicase HrpA
LFRVEVRTKKAFEQHIEETRSTINERARMLHEAVVRVLEGHLEMRITLRELERSNRDNHQVVDLLSKIMRDVESLVPADFPIRYSSKHLASLPRYLKAHSLRAERGAHDVMKDSKKAADLEELARAFAEEEKGMSGHASPEKQSALDDFRWMMEEFRVSLFAQEMKTPFPVSKKRLERRLKEISAMR